jgi:carbon-monoxide dehydrogenase medium subunit
VKPVSFELLHPTSLADASRALLPPDARALAGGQSLGPMLNLRLAAPALLVSLGRLPELCGVAEDADAVTLGACVTHAAIADGRTPDVGDRILAGIAERIAYRAVRNRGTIGGSLCHADPAADWPCTLTALGAIALVRRPDGGTHEIPVAEFITGAFRTALGPGEVLLAVRIPRTAMRWGYFKACRKPGEFAHAMAAVRIDPAGGGQRIVIGATGTRPLLFGSEAEAVAGLRDSGLDPIALHMQMVAMRRALDRAGS